MQRYLLYFGMMLFLMLLPVGTCWGLMIAPDGTVPVERLISSLTKQIESAEKPAEIHGQLARVHSIAFSIGQKYFQILEREGAYTFYGGYDSYSRFTPNVSADKMSEERFGHLLDAIEHYLMAVQIEPDKDYYHLGLGYTLRLARDNAARIASLEGATPTEAEIKSIELDYENKALEAYRKAFALGKEGYNGPLCNSVRAEAASAIAEILSARPNPTDDEKREIKHTKRTAIEFRNCMHAISPIIFSLEDTKPIEQLLALDKEVKFDLDGRGAHNWHWVKPDTAFLVWDADGRGDIRSGKQLIGSVTWWIFWDNGYQVLQALDDEKDGWLSGEELTGLAVWRDGNSNGVSEQGEVVPLAATGIKRLSTNVEGQVNGMPYNSQGLQLNDGRALPTYDWIAQPIR